MATSDYTAQNESVRGRKKKSYEEVMQRRKFAYMNFIYPEPSDWNKKYDSISDVMQDLETNAQKQWEEFLKTSPYDWFDISFQYYTDGYGFKIAVCANRYETDKEYEKRTKAWTKIQNKKISNHVKQILNKYESDINTKR